MYYTRSIQDSIEKNLFKGKVIIIYGARQVGKTTLVKEILKKYGGEGRYLNCEILQNKTSLETTNSENLKAFLGGYKLTILDEAQRIENIGLILKVLVDTFPDMQIIATGSSSFDLANKISEPLTGRARRYVLYPLSLREIRSKHDLIEINARLENILRFGSYPGVFNLRENDAKANLDEIASNYLYKDILEFEKIKRNDLVINLLRALALQMGNEVSCHELAKLLGASQPTIEKYLQILEQCFIVFKLRAFSRNLRKEIGKGFKVYFFDTGIRNSLIQNFNAMQMRSDLGALWENFCIAERQRHNQARNLRVNAYFWRTYDQQEIDYIEESGGKLEGYEFKWSPTGSYRVPRLFLDTYEGSTVTKIDSENYWKFLMEQ